MQSARQGRALWLVALGLAAAIAVIWFVASRRAEDEGPARLPERAVEPAQVAPPLPTAGPRQPAGGEPLALDAASVGTALATEPEPSAVEARIWAALRVHVFDPSDRPLDWAEVKASRGQPRVVCTDAEGVIHIESDPGASITVVARHPDYRLAMGKATLGVAGSYTDITLSLTDELSACIEIQARDGRPIAGATLRFKEVEAGVSDGARQGSDADLDAWETSQHLQGDFEERRKTDAMGRCCVNGVVSGHVAVSVDAEGYVPVLGQHFVVDADGGDLGVIVLEPALTATGFVFDAAGPVPDALVEARIGIHFRRMPDDGEEDYTEFYRRTTTGADGSFSLGGVQSFPANADLHVSHPKRGHFYDGKRTLTVEPARVVLVPDLSVRFLVTDAEVDQPLEGEAWLYLRLPRGESLLYQGIVPRDHGVAQVRPVAIEAGLLDVVGLPYYIEQLDLELADYDVAEVPMTTIATDADGVIELALKRPVTLLVRVRAAGSGELIEQARLMVGNVKAGKKGTKLPSFRLLMLPFDADAGGIVVSESELGFADSLETTLAAQAKGYADGAPVTVAVEGQRTSASTVDIYLEPE